MLPQTVRPVSSHFLKLSRSRGNFYPISIVSNPETIPSRCVSNNDKAPSPFYYTFRASRIYIRFSFKQQNDVVNSLFPHFFFFCRWWPTDCNMRDSRTSPPSPPYPGFPPAHSPYLRRISPPGSPASRKCCQHDDSHKSTFLCCCYTCPGSRSTSVLATVGVCCLVLGYTIMGAFVFMALEGGLYKDFDAVAASKVDPSRNIIGKYFTF